MKQLNIRIVIEFYIITRGGGVDILIIENLQLNIKMK